MSASPLSLPVGSCASALLVGGVLPKEPVEARTVLTDLSGFKASVDRMSPAFLQSVLNGAEQYDEVAEALASAALASAPADPSGPSHTSPSPLMRELMDSLFPSGYSFG